jgi:hypothetical protein
VNLHLPKFDKMRREWHGYVMELEDINGVIVWVDNPGAKQAAFIENWEAFKVQWWRPLHHLLDVRTESYRWAPYWSAHVWVPIEVTTVCTLIYLLWRCHA